MTTKQRRRNMRAESCRACGKMCEAGHGYLYRDTHTTRRNRFGSFLWFVKCEECHSGGKSRAMVAVERAAASQPEQPTVRPWTVSQVKAWGVMRGIGDDGEATITIDAEQFSEVVSYRDPITSRFTAPSGYHLEQSSFCGKPLSQNASNLLSEKIVAIVNAVQHEEQQEGERAAELLRAAGATVRPLVTGFGWDVEYKGGRYSLFGGVQKNTMMGWPFAGGPWTETTAEQILAGV